MELLPLIIMTVILWLIVGFLILAPVYDGFNKHKFEIASAIVLFWPLLAVACVLILLFSVIIGAFKGLYFILIEFIRKGIRNEARG